MLLRAIVFFVDLDASGVGKKGLHAQRVPQLQQKTIWTVRSEPQVGIPLSQFWGFRAAVSQCSSRDRRFLFTSCT
jgi:hypothetical protein